MFRKEDVNWARKYLKVIRIKLSWGNLDKKDETFQYNVKKTFDIADEAMAKQEMVEPVFKKKYPGETFCPICGAKVLDQYCGHCGQRVAGIISMT